MHGIHWERVDHRLPDDDQSVVIFTPECSEPIWLGYHSDGCWYSAEGYPLGGAVKAWAELPAGPDLSEEVAPCGA